MDVKVAKKLKTDFVDVDEVQTAEKEFNRYIGPDSVWFTELLYDIKRSWIDTGSKITDILIREKTPVMLASIKAHVQYRFSNPSNGRVFLEVDRNHISDIVRRFAEFDENKQTGVSVDFSFYVMGLGIFRGNYSIDAGGAGLSLRYLSFNIPTFDEIGYPTFYKREIERLVEKVTVKTPYGIVPSAVVRGGGLIVHVGPTGSGKTTAMAAEIGYLAEETTGAIITYENPIEYRYVVTRAPVRQFEIGKDIKKDEENTLLDNLKRHLLRNNPSIVLIGEGRDNKDIRMMMDTSLKGHLVFGTIHASDIMEALATLVSVVKGEEYICATALRAIVAHRLFTNRQGKIIPIFEILIPTEQDRLNIAEVKLDLVSNALQGKDSKHRSGVTFLSYIDDLVKYGKIEMEEARELTRSIKGHS